MALPKSFIPRSQGGQPKPKRGAKLLSAAPVVLTVVVLVLGFFSLPHLVALDVQLQQDIERKNAKPAFPISVDPAKKEITFDPRVEALVNQNFNSLDAAVGSAQDFFGWLASLISALPAYQSLGSASLGATSMRIVTIKAGYRQEEVAYAFGKALGWSYATQKKFIAQAHSTAPKLSEGEFAPGTYVVYAGESPSDVQYLVYQHFNDSVLSHYASTTAEKVPLKDALTIASLLEREAGGWDDMRQISGIMWNRLFVNMNLQIDATLQYAKANNSSTIATWWPAPKPADKYQKSAYNTYMHAGLPPGPIANPSVAAVLAALNPVQTDCLFYFHDRYGNFHCSATYAGHVKLLKKYYGQGK